MKIKSINNEVVTLLTNDKNKYLSFTNFIFFGRRGSFTCKVNISSRGFKYEKEVCFDNMSTFIENIEKMSSTLLGETELNKEFSENFIKFSLNKNGRVIVSASFVEYSEHSQNIFIEFESDQTCLAPLAKELRKVVNYS